MKKLVLLVSCIIIIGTAYLLGRYLIHSKPKPIPNEVVEQLPYVDILIAKKTIRKTTIETFGTVKARTQTNLIAEVSGLIEAVAPFSKEFNSSVTSFRNGGFFEKGDLLLKIEDTDLLARKADAMANQKRTEYQLAQERALAEQAKTEWGDRDWSKASDLVKRIPQIQKAEAEAKSAQAHYHLAVKNLARAEVRAPFRGRILNILADVGQQVGAGASSSLAQIYSIKTGDVHFSLSNKELSFLGFTDGLSQQSKQITAQILDDDEKVIHQGSIDRSLGIIDPKTRLHNLVASFENCFTDPFTGSSLAKKPLVLGQFVKLKLIGPEIGIFVVPISSFRSMDTILILDQDNRLKLRKVKTIKKNGVDAWIKTGVKDGEKICITPLDIIAEGMKVRISKPVIDSNSSKL